MSHLTAMQLEINGAAPTADLSRALLLNGYGHFTAMQVRDRRVCGLDLHLARLAEGNAELFGSGLDGDRIRQLIRHALGPETTDASVRVYLQRPDPAQPPTVTVIVRPPAVMPAERTLQSVPYQRAVAHIKHLGDFGQRYYALLAERNGFDEALLTGQDGLISEGSVTNIGFFDGTAVCWPAAPMLAGITMQVAQRELSRAAVPQRHGPVRLADLGAFRSVFVTNSQGIAAVTRVDDLALPVDADFMKRLADSYASASAEEI
jgi:branched-subunit amino acid aminotransferase/4-amino-4-deoxychorismate lyase